MRASIALLALFSVVACSGNRNESLNSGRDLNTAADAGGGSPPAVPERPLRKVNVGATGGQVASRSYRARMLLSFPAQPGLAKASGHSVRLLPGEAP